MEWSGGGEAPGAERNRSTSRKAEPHGGADKLDGGPDKWMQNRTEGCQIDRITRSLRSGGFWILLEWFWQDFEKLGAHFDHIKRSLASRNREDLYFIS